MAASNPNAPVQTHRSWGRTLHAVTALVLMVLFFITAALAVAGLVFLGYHVGLGALEHLRGKALILGALVGLGMIIAGVVVAWSLVPRFDTFEAPGPELLRAEHPELFREIDRVAAMTGERGPAQVYAVGDVNAFVAERGGLMGIGSRRVMGLGLPLLNVLTVSQLRAVLAHEFGHFAGGDTSLGRWIHKTRGALVRTLNNLGHTGNALSEIGALALVFTVVHAPFRWFFTFYMGFTQSLSRRQEFDADALAVQLEGAPALTEGLTRVRGAAAAYGAFVEGELQPLVSKGLLPPVGLGFQQFLAAERIATQVTRLVSTPTETDPHDSHPPLEQRIAAAQKLRGPVRAVDPRLGIELVRNVAALEVALARAWTDEAQPLKTIGWEQSSAPLEAQWRAAVESRAAHFPGVTLASIAPELPALRTLAQRQHGVEAVAGSSDETIKSWARQVLTEVLFVLLLEQQYAVSNRPGKPYLFTRNGEHLEPGELVNGYLAGEVSAETWRTQLEALGVSRHDLALQLTY